MPLSPTRAVHTVLVVDALAADRDLHALLLRELGLRAVSAAGGWEALVCARTVLPDLIVTDLRMPELDGYGLIQQLRAHPATASIPVVMVTGDAAEVSLLRLRGTGMAALLPKPLELAEFRRVIRGLLPAAGSVGMVRMIHDAPEAVG